MTNHQKVQIQMLAEVLAALTVARTAVDRVHRSYGLDGEYQIQLADQLAIWSGEAVRDIERVVRSKDVPLPIVPDVSAIAPEHQAVFAAGWRAAIERIEKEKTK